MRSGTDPSMRSWLASVAVDEGGCVSASRRGAVRGTAVAVGVVSMLAFVPAIAAARVKLEDGQSWLRLGFDDRPHLRATSPMRLFDILNLN